MILSPIDCEAVNDPHLHLDDRGDSVEDKAGYILIDRTRHLTGSYVSLVFDQIDSTLWQGLSYSLNFGLLQIWFSNLHFFFPGRLIILFIFDIFIDVFLDCLIVGGGIVGGIRGVVEVVQ